MVRSYGYGDTSLLEHLYRFTFNFFFKYKIKAFKSRSFLKHKGNKKKKNSANNCFNLPLVYIMEIANEQSDCSEGIGADASKHAISSRQRPDPNFLIILQVKIRVYRQNKARTIAIKDVS